MMNNFRKTTIVLLALVMTVQLANGQGAYEKGMKEALESLFAPDNSKENLTAAANKLERILQVEQDKWQPVYYAALAYAWLATKEEMLGQQDAKMTQAANLIETGLERSPDNVELITLQGYADMLSLSFDAGTRGQTMSTRVFATFGRAIQMDPKNPRARLFMGQMQAGTEQFFGQGNEASCKTLQMALQNYDLEKDRPDFLPSWGRGMAEHMLKNCGSGVSENE